jgi:5'-nucleotidase
MSKTMGFTETELETRFSVIRKQEANWSNLFADIVRIEMKADCTIINSGTIRSDCIFPKGKLILKDISKMLPF